MGIAKHRNAYSFSSLLPYLAYSLNVPWLKRRGRTFILSLY